MKKAGMEAVKIKSRSDLEKIRRQVDARLTGKTRVVVGLGTCGQAAGAQQVYDAIAREIQALELRDVVLEATGCVGICQFEPVVEVYRPQQPRTTYVRMTPERGVRMVRQHIQGGNPLAEFTIGAAQSGR